MALDQAREYLARVLPWPPPGQPGFINIHWTQPDKKGGGKPYWVGRAVTSMAEAVRALDWALKLQDTLDVYVCMSQQAAATAKTSAKGYAYNLPIRLAQNALWLKSFWLDVDYGKLLKDGTPDPKSYPTPDAAILAVKAFYTTLGLPKPTMIVHSGGGFHVYWTIDRAITPAEWLPYAFALAEAGKQHGLLFDSQCTVDSARVLRIPDTHNHKQALLRAVHIVGSPQDFDYLEERVLAALRPYVGATRAAPAGVDANLFPFRPHSAQPSELQGSMADTFPRPDLDLVAKRCAFIGDALATGGVSIDGQPLWNLATLIAAHSVGGRADAHRMAHLNPHYVQTDADDLYDRKVREVQERGIGWPSCNAISSAGAKQCAGCPLFAHGKSPLNFEMLVTPKVTNFIPSSGITQIDMPQGYLRTPAGLIGKLTPDLANPNGPHIALPICDYPMDDAWLQMEPRTLHFRTVIDRGKPGQISIETEVINTAEMRKVLQSQGLMLRAGDKSMGDFLMSWIRHLQTIKDSVNTAPFGWQYEGETPEGFIFGDRLWGANGDTPSAAGSRKMQIRYRPKGTVQTWLDATKLVCGMGRPDLEVLVASAFAAPLVTFTGHNGLLLSAFSRESGVGKTTAVEIAQAVWGNPKTGKQGLTDTENAIIGICAELKSLPLYWDELKSEEQTKKFVNMTFQITSGKGKSRMDSRAQLKEPGDWQTLVISASNESLIEHVVAHTPTTAAGLMRIFEYRVKPIKPPDNTSSVAQIMLARVYNSYGNVGLEYAKWLGANHVAIAAEMATFAAALEKEVNGTQEERFWVSLIAVILLAAKYANQLGYRIFDEPAMKEFLLDELANMRANRGVHTVDLDKSVNVSAVLNAFFNEVKQHNGWLVTDRIHVGAGKPPKNSVKIIHPVDSRMNGVAVQVSAPGGNDLLRISGHGLGQWCKKVGINRYNLMEAMSKMVTYRTVVGKLGSGTHLSGSTEQLYELDLTTSTDLDFING